MKRPYKQTTKRCLALLSATALSFGMLSSATAQLSNQRGISDQSLNKTPIKAIKKTNKNAASMMFVRFETPSVAEMLIEQKSKGAQRASAGAQRGYANRISAEHNKQRASIESMGIKVLSTMRVGANGMRVSVTPAQADQLRALAGVREVSHVLTHTLDLSNSVGWVGTPQVWDSVGDGENITIAIIDSGIDYLHANNGGSGLVADYDNNDKNIVEPGTFPTAKVIGGYDFAGPIYNPGSDDPDALTPQPDADPLDGNGHGSHVAGISAGIGNDFIGPGVAKGASLYALKVFNDTSGSTNLTADAIEWALDPNGDGDMSDHVDVINMSLGSPFGSPNSPSAIASNNASEMGVIVVASAGNSGAVPYVTGAPAVGAGVISVAASLTGGDVLAIHVQDAPAEGFYEAVEGGGAVRLADGGVTGNMVVAEPLTGCSADADGNPLGLDNDIAGGIALIQRGGCSFDLKVLNSQMSGASGLVVYNDGTSPSRVAPITMGGIGNLGIAIEIPSVMIPSTSGDLLNSTITGGDALNVELNANLTGPTLFGDTMAGFSSRGPGHSNSTFKPDMSAPGVSTVSTGAGSGDQSLSISGTSMAAPHVAGAAALMRQAFPDASVPAIKAMLMNSTVDAQPDGLIGPAHSLSRQGVGVLRVDQAVSLSSYATPAGVSYGRVNPSNKKRVREFVTVTNLSDVDRTYSITHVPQTTVAGASMRVQDSIDVPAGGTARFSTILGFDAALADGDDGSFSQGEVDGWFVLNDGQDTLRVGYFGVVDGASWIRATGRQDAVVLHNRGKAPGIAQGFTHAVSGDDDSDDSAEIRAVGYRTVGAEIMQIAVDLGEIWETMSDRTFDIYLDTDSDGSDDVLLQATDFSDFDGDIGTMVTAQFDLVNGGAFLDFFVSIGDYNDSTAAFTFSRVADGGLVPDQFDFRVEVSSSDGSSDSVSGSVDVSNEIIPLNATVEVAAQDKLTVDTNRADGNMLWLFQNNEAGRQSNVARIR